MGKLRLRGEGVESGASAALGVTPEHTRCARLQATFLPHEPLASRARLLSNIPIFRKKKLSL